MMNRNKNNKNQVTFGLDEEDINGLLYAFKRFDVEKDSKINPKLLVDILKKEPAESQNPIMLEIFEGLCEKAIREGEEKISYEVFMNAVYAKLSEKNTKVGADKVFQMFDKKRAKVLTIDSLKAIVDDTEENITQEELQDMIYRVSSDGNVIVPEDFRNAIMRSSF